MAGLDLQPEARGYPPVIDARREYLTVGRRGDIGVDIDWIEFVSVPVLATC